MKRIVSVALAVLLALLVCGCGKAEEPAASEPADVGVGLANPVKIVTPEEQAAAGLTLNAPEGAENVVYKLIEDLIETDFTLDGVEYFYRAIPAAGPECSDISGLYYTWTTTEEGSVAGREAVANICGEAGFVMWLDVVPGINYNLCCAAPVTAEKLFEVAALVFAPVQGEVG